MASTTGKAGGHTVGQTSGGPFEKGDHVTIYTDGADPYFDGMAGVVIEVDEVKSEPFTVSVNGQAYGFTLEQLMKPWWLDGADGSAAAPGADDGLTDHCGCCHHSRTAGCGGPHCPCAPKGTSNA